MRLSWFEVRGKFVVLARDVGTQSDDSLHLELTQLIEDQKREEIRLGQEQNLRWAFFVAPILFLIFGHILTSRFWFLPMAIPVVAALLGTSFEGSEDRFHALFWGNVLALGAYFLYARLDSAVSHIALP